MKADEFLLTNGRIVLPRAVLDEASVLVRGGRIKAVLEKDERLPQGPRRIDLGGALVSPGLIELHILGCGGIGFDDLGPNLDSGIEALRAARAFLRERGVTSFVPTLLCREAELSALAAAIEASGIAEDELPGIYVEGPFVNQARRGGIPADTIREPDSAYLGRLINLTRGRLKLMTVAPELPGSREIIARLQAVGVLPCLGHSDCRLDRIRLPDGRFSITHLFNAMSPFSHKEPGLAMLPFLDRRPYVELNGDGVHVNEAALRVCAAAIDPERLILVSDAVIAAGMPHGEYSYYGTRILSGEDGVRYADSGTLMGSNFLAPDVLRNWLAVTGSSAENAVRMLSLTPAQALGMEGRRGAIAAGLDATLVVWEGEFEAVRTIYG
ncbi:MAG TPA: N-acetylglucosamine-6-phosphate deacetylase [Rectinemataceae bacterium]|nr:N-acetylglucosamine-6-phosphate deacetylase [Rectinemataceae bacterium]